ncbi:MAG: hypothetical protein WAL29_09345 [Bacteroidales bacterium]
MKANFLMTIGNQAYEFIDFDFVELRFAPVLRLPRPHLAPLKRLREGEVGSEENKTR